MIRQVLLVAVLAFWALPASTATGQEPSVASRQSFDQLLQAAEKAREENQDDQAIQLFRRALKEQPESEQALWYLSTLLYESQQYRESRDLLRQFVTLRPDAGPAWGLLGISEYQLREYPRALEHLQRATAQGVGNRRELAQSVSYDTAVLLTLFERYDDSLDVLQKMAASGSDDPTLTGPAGLAGLRLPLLPAEMPPDRRELVDFAGRAVLAVQTQHYQQADSEFKRLVSAYPNEPGVHFLYGAYLLELHPNDAVPELERELEISPAHVLARVRLAQQLIAQGEFDRALTLAQQAIKLDPRRASAHMLAGEALVGKGSTGDGIKELEIARDGDPSVKRIHWDLVRAYAAAGRQQDADREKQEMDKLYHGSSLSGLQPSGDGPRDLSQPQ